VESVVVRYAAGILRACVWERTVAMLLQTVRVLAVLCGRGAEQSVIGRPVAGAVAGRSGVLVVLVKLGRPRFPDVDLLLSHAASRVLM
jgi:hypothetical protein